MSVLLITRSIRCMTPLLSKDINYIGLQYIHTTAIRTSEVKHPPTKPISEEKHEDGSLKGRFMLIMSSIEDLAGITEVRLAQERTEGAMQMFTESQDTRRIMQQQLMEKEILWQKLRLELDKRTRGDEDYIETLKQETRVMKDVELLRQKFTDCERKERDDFSAFSSAYVQKLDKERLRNERMRYWIPGFSILASVISYVIYKYKEKSVKMDNVQLSEEFFSLHSKINELQDLVQKKDCNQEKIMMILEDLQGRLQRNESNAKKQSSWTSSYWSILSGIGYVFQPVYNTVKWCGLRVYYLGRSRPTVEDE